MNRDQIVDLLGMIQMYDNRETSPVMVTAWHESAMRARWQPEEVYEVVHDHFAKSTSWLMPGHVTQGIKVLRDARREPFRAPPALEGPVSSAEVREGVLELLRSKRASKGVRSA